ncbi:MAG: SMC-Scp complex subunit ScpB [archaeon]
MEETKTKEAHFVPVITESTAQELDNVFEDNERNSTEKIEAALFIAGRFLTLQELIMLTDVNPVMLKEILRRLEKKYSNGVLRLINRGNAWKMDIIEKYYYLINKLATGNAEFTKAEQETLAIIAYKQPIKQSVIIKIRGNKSYDHIKKFRQLGLIVGKRVGHTLDISLSEEFYEYFNVTPSASESTEQTTTRENNKEGEKE